MIVLKVIGVIFVVLFILTLIPARLNLSYRDDEFSAVLRYGILRFKLFPAKEKVEKEKKITKKSKRTPKTKDKSKSLPKTPTPEIKMEPIDKPDKPQNKREFHPPPHKKVEKKNSEAKSKEDDSPKDSSKNIKQLWELIKSSKKALKILKNHFIIKNLDAYIVVGGEDAHQTALNFSKFGTLITTSIGFLSEFFKLKLKQIVLIPDFLAAKNYYDVSVQLSIRPIFILAAGFSLLISFVQTNSSNKKVNNEKKGGIKHESTKTVK